jgi:MoxR-like ATPase
VFLIDEIDCADEKFEAFLLEFPSNFQVCILEIGTVKAKARPSSS